MDGRRKARSSKPSTFRSGATFWPFLVWALAAGTGAVFAEREALARPEGLHRWIFHGLFAAGLLLGPLSLLLQCLRRLLSTVRLEPSRGLILRGERLVPWSAIESVVHHPSPLNNTSSFLDNDEAADELTHVPGELAAPIMLVRALLSIVYYLLLPPLLLLSPWHPRVILTLRDYEGRLVFRDLERDGEFVYRVRKAIGPPARNPTDGGSGV